MAVAEAWASVDGGPIEAAVLQAGDRWWFPVPRGMTGSFIAEIWATDDAGNQSYAVAVLTIEAGALKCIRWVKGHGIARMLPVERPAVSVSFSRPTLAVSGRPTVSMAVTRPTATMMPHTCRRAEACHG